MSNNHETKVNQLVEKVKHYGKPMFIFLRVIAWELPLSWAYIFAACSLAYVILYNLSIKTFSCLGLLAIGVDFYCTENKIEIPELTPTEKKHLHQVCSKLITVQTKAVETVHELKAAHHENPSYLCRQICLFLLLAIVASSIIDNLLLSYLIGSTFLLMIGIFCPQTNTV